MRLWPVLACLAAASLASAPAASAYVHHGQQGYDSEEIFPGQSGYDPGYDPGADNGSWTGPQQQSPGAASPSDPVPPNASTGTTVPWTPPAPAAPSKPATPKLPSTPLQPATPDIPTVSATTGTVAGKVAMLRTDGKAAIPRGAPAAVRAAIAAANQIIGKPYKWGGGHAKVIDSGYDCSGAVSYSLIGARELAGPMVSGGLAKWAQQGPGQWITIYANAGHVYMEIAGLRLDTSPVGDPTGEMGVRWRPVIGRRVGFHARHILGL